MIMRSQYKRLWTLSYPQFNIDDNDTDIYNIHMKHLIIAFVLIIMVLGLYCGSKVGFKMCDDIKICQKI